jgi:signal peptidase I
MPNHLKDVTEIITAFVVAWVFYQGLAFATGTSMPIVSVVSESMEPILHRGDLLFVTGADDFQVNDIVIYQRSEVQYTIVHRIIEVQEDGYVIKGDNNPVPDAGVVKQEQIVGKVLFAVPLLGYPRLVLYLVGI